MILRLDNPVLSGNEKTFLTRTASDGDTSYTVESNEGFSANNNIVFGEVGEEDAECVLVASTTGDHTITASAIRHDHPQGTPIYFTPYNQYSVDVKPTGGSYAVAAGMPRDIEWDSVYSEFIYGGATTDTYKFRFYNSTTAGYSVYSPEISGTGHTKNSVRYMTDNVLQIAKDPEARVASRDQIRYWFNAAQDQISSLNDRWWFLFKEGEAIPSVISTPRYNLPSDFDRLDHLICHFDDGTSDLRYRLKYIPIHEFEYETSDQDASDDDNTTVFTLWPPDGTYTYGSFEVSPTPEHAYHDFYPWYYKKMTDLSDDNDETDVPNPEILENYALAQLEETRNNQERANGYMRQFEAGINILKRWDRKQTGQPRALAFKGRTNIKRFYGERGGYNEDIKLNYF